MPEQIREVLDDLRLGRLSLTASDPGLAHATDRLGRRVLTALVSSTAIAAGSWLLVRGQPTTGTTLLVFALVTWVGHVLMDTYRSWHGPKRP